MAVAQPPRHGPWHLGDGRVRFALWAPDARSVHLSLPEAQLPMERDDEGFYQISVSCEAGARYQFLIDGEQLVPDPAARWQPDGVAGASAVPERTPHFWHHAGWPGRPWHEAVIYELHTGLCGGFNGVRQQLPALKALGITAIELMPVGSFPGQRNWGYDPVLPFAPAAAYGSPAELMALIDDAHGLDLLVYLDVVYNHFGPEGNYLPHYASAFFDTSRQTPWGPAIDFTQPAVRAFYLENALMWLRDYRFDGLRLDAVHAINNDEFVVWLAAQLRAALPAGRSLHLMVENERNSASLLRQGLDAQWHDDAHHVLHTLLTGERDGYYADFQQQPTTKLARALSEGFVYQGEPTRRGEPRGEPCADLPPQAFIIALQNHDQIGNRAFGERLLSLADPVAVRCATAAFLLSPMIPLLFMGEEHGSITPFLYFVDYQGELAEAVRNGRRQEFSTFAGFAANIPDPIAPATFQASRPAPADDGFPWPAFYRELLTLRQAIIMPALPGSHAEPAQLLGDGAVLWRWQLGDGSQLLIALNLGLQPVALPIDNATAVPLFTHGITERNPPAPSPLALTPPGDALPAPAVAIYLQAAAGHSRQDQSDKGRSDAGVSDQGLQKTGLQKRGLQKKYPSKKNQLEKNLTEKGQSGKSGHGKHRSEKYRPEKGLTDDHLSSEGHTGEHPAETTLADAMRVWRGRSMRGPTPEASVGGQAWLR
ncbi:malto-oligosyltrehalose trehalohydrolase [Alcanivorax quisquiliarum]|uniref:Malto-oligosyltrehalose trehalohydrolase n=1 Tax=Alcanivorax quisquiliarum TaxID=2933565 RepID=A0ABT0E9C5_9GAMM|nr:malto-oligosyltrehalose trehalohydrolase [Alcanivorax quisquiliarum]MCK0538399.1 malto-oligosyltrehalose trehalohydrolase [Alcanivorax quisquiliarum]